VSAHPLVSVIIPCYNHARYLAEAVSSVKLQTYRHYEIIIVDDGSTDDTHHVASKFSELIYIRQENSGLSAARNTGIKNAKGNFMVFLDADDYLYPSALKINLEYLLSDKTLAFVSGAHDKVDVNGSVIPEDHGPVINQNHYRSLLEGNYIGMHAAVMYSRWIFEKFQFDTALKACEDYDLYLRVARKHPVLNHNEKIAAYRIHGENMSANIPFMLTMVLQVHNRQKSQLLNDEERRSYERGIEIWREYYIQKLYQALYKQVVKENVIPSPQDVNALKVISKTQGSRLQYHIVKQNLKKQLKRSLPTFVRRVLHRQGLIKHFVPQKGNVEWGDLERTSPFSNCFGYDRGGPVDRYYIENFLDKNKDAIKGRTFEIGDNAYSIRFGGNNIIKSDVLHVYRANDTVTFIGDLTNVPEVPSNAFDCIILTQTLHLIYDFKAALNTCYRILKPGGSLLLTVPGITHIDKDEWKEFWLWAFTDKSMQKIFSETFPAAQTEIRTYGNVYVASAFLYGLGLPEIRKDFLDVHDPSYQVIISVKATKKAE
jgi:glycosyltransferase involved in cell wall biosynthesis